MSKIAHIPFILIKDLENCKEFITGEKNILHELLHSDKIDLKLQYSLTHTPVKPGDTSEPHHLKNSEIYYILI